MRGENVAVSAGIGGRKRIGRILCHARARLERQGIVRHANFRIEIEGTGNAAKPQFQFSGGCVEEERRRCCRRTDHQVVARRRQICETRPLCPLGCSRAAGFRTPKRRIRIKVVFQNIVVNSRTGKPRRSAAGSAINNIALCCHRIERDRSGGIGEVNRVISRRINHSENRFKSIRRHTFKGER